MTKKFLFLPIFLGLLNTNCFAWKLIKGDKELRDGSTFSFPVKKTFVGQNNHVFIGAAQSGAKNFALSFLNPNQLEFTSYAPEKISINGAKDQINPIFDAAIEHIAEINATNVAVILRDDPNLYTVHALYPNAELFSIPLIYDASGINAHNGVVAIAGGEDRAFLAIKGSGQEQFGIGDSGIALVAFHEEEVEKIVDEKELAEIKKKLEGKSEEEIEAVNKNMYVDKDNVTKKKIKVTTFSQVSQKKAIPLSLKSDLVKIGGDLNSLDIIDMHWSSALKRLYVAMQAKGGSNEDDGVCGIAVGYVDAANNLTLYPIVSHELLKRFYDDRIVGGIGSETHITINKVRTLQTTTGFLDYLIVQGGLGEPEKTQRCVYALPLLNFQDKNGTIDPALILKHGTLAAIHGSLLEEFNTNRTGAFLGRHFNGEPKTANDLYSAHTPAAQVGAGPLCYGSIHDLIIKDDAVYAIVKDADERYTSAVYHSQALFDADGRISAWTAWKKMHESEQPIFTMALNRQTGNHITFTGGHDDAIRTLKQNEWVSDSGIFGLAQAITNEFPKNKGGIHNLIDLPAITPGLKGISLLCATGLSKVVLTPMAPLMVFDPSQLLAFNGGILDELGPINAAEIGTNDIHGWIFVGGVNGLAVLCNADGSGWNMNEGLDFDLQPLRTMAFKRIGNYKFVRKIIADKQFLYILTDTELDRIDLNTVDFTTFENLMVTPLIDSISLAKNIYGTFYDLIISEKCAVIAHSAGMHRIGNGNDIRIDDQTTINWMPIDIPTSDPIISLVPISVSGRAQDVARYDAGQIYAMSGNIGKNKGYVYRFVVHNVVDTSISDTTIQQLKDFGAKNRISYFANLGSYNAAFATNGTLYFGATNKKKTKSPEFISGFGKMRTIIPLALNDAASISAIVQSSATGHWLVAGDFGLIVND